MPPVKTSPMAVVSSSVAPATATPTPSGTNMTTFISASASARSPQSRHSLAPGDSSSVGKSVSAAITRTDTDASAMPIRRARRPLRAEKNNSVNGQRGSVPDLRGREAPAEPTALAAPPSGAVACGLGRSCLGRS